MLKVWSYRRAIRESKLESNTKLVLLTLSIYMNENGDGCYPSIDALVSDTSLARATVIKHIELAAQAGFLTKKKHGYAGKRWGRNEYFATYPQGSSAIEPPDEGKAVQPLNHLTRAGGSTDEGQAVQPLNSNTTENTPKKKDPPTPKGEGKGNDLFGGQSSAVTSDQVPGIEEQFLEFWAVYPKKKGRAEAEAKFNIALRTTPFAAILHGAKCYADECAADRRPDAARYVAYAKTWLFNKRWLDFTEQVPLTPGQRERVSLEEHFPGSSTHC